MSQPVGTQQPVGTLYLIHLDSPIEHAQHYLGWTDDFEQRFKAHKGRRGAAFLAEAVRRKIDFAPVRFWENKTRDDERVIKNRRNVRPLCPICRAEHLERRKLRRLMKKHEVNRIDWTQKKKKKIQKVNLPKKTKTTRSKLNGSFSVAGKVSTQEVKIND